MYPVNLQVLDPQAEHESGGQREELQQERRVLQREGSLGRIRIFGLGVLVVGHLGPLDSPSADSFLELRLKHAPLRPFHARHCGPRVAETKGRSALNKLERENVPQALSTRNQKAVPCMREQSDWICISQIDVSASPPSITGSC